MASKRRVRKAQCINRRTGNPKIKYDTRDEAQPHADRLNRTHLEHHSPFKCDTCHKWHVGVTPGGPGRTHKMRFVRG